MRHVIRAVATVLLVAAVLAVAVALGWGAERPTRDTAFAVERFQRDVVVEPTGRLQVTEQLDVRFFVGRRGIFRDLPRASQAGPVFYGNFAVDQGSADQPWNFVLEDAGNGDTRVRIGDAGITLSPGLYRYRLRYTIDDLVFIDRTDPSVVEVRLDVPGFAWPTDIGPTALRVALPGPVFEVDCVAGSVGSTEDCPEEPIVTEQQVGVRLGSFAPERSATVAIRADASAFTGDLPVHRPDALRSAAFRLPAIPTAVALAILFLLPFAVFEVFKAVRVYRDVETDAALHDRLHPTALPEPPDGMSPVEVAGLLRKAGDALFLASLVDLDQRGVVNVEVGAPTPEAPPGASRRERRRAEKAAAEAAKHAVIRVGDTSQVPAVYQGFVRDLLPGGAALEFTGTYDSTVASRSTSATQDVTARAADVFEDNGLLHGEGGMLRSTAFKFAAFVLWLGWAGLLGLTAVLVSDLSLLAPAILGVATVIAWAITRAMWSQERLPLNSEGRDAIARARSFEEYLRSVEVEQLEWAASQQSIDQRHPAVRLLPYAIALGLAASWYARFGDIMTRVAAGTAAGATAWWASRSSFDSLASSRSSSVTSPSSSSGGGGGGSGGGGGGGGSW